jgi:hypothetical protein
MSLVGDGSGLTNLPGGGAASDVNCSTPCISTLEIVDNAVTSAKITEGTILNADLSASAAIDPTKIAGTAATLGANTFNGTQTIAAGALGVGTITPASKLDVVGNIKASGGVSVGGSGLLANLTAKGGSAFVATGTVSTTSSSSAVTGSGTAFLSELSVGDRILISSISRPVISITSNTSLTVSFPPGDFSSQPMTVFPAIVRADSAAGVSQLLLTDQGNLQLGAVFSATPRLLVYQANRFAGTSTGASINQGHIAVITSSSAAADVGGILGLGGNQGTSTTMFAGLRGAKENGTTDDSRGYLGFYTTDVSSTFAERARLTSTGNLGIGTNNPTEKLDVAGTVKATAFVGDGSGLTNIPGVTGFTVLGNGNVGIGNTSPTARLDVNGGVRISPVSTKPACDASVRGMFWVTAEGPGVEDSVEVCLKNSADAYVWRTIL